MRSNAKKYVKRYSVRSRFFKKNCWRSLIDTRSEKNYLKMRKFLDEAGVDYRIWMDEDDEDLVFLREHFGHPERFRVYYKFYVRDKELRKAQKVLQLGRFGIQGAFGINAMFM